jgi:uncharacterized protein (DUF305 family)
VVAGCGGSNKEPVAATPEPVETAVNVVQPGAPGEPSRKITVTPTPEGRDFVAADAEFMRGMIHHHDQAVRMTRWVPDRTASTSIRLLAKRMEVSQVDEIAMMKRWLKDRGEETGGHEHTDTSMPGMLSQEQLDQLENAKATEFDRLFLQFMTQHHQGALQMVADLYNAGGGQEPEIAQFAMHVDSDQNIEIARMAELAAKL